MNTDIPVQYALLSLAFLICISSCTFIHFDKPQPVDAEDLKEIPVTLQGCWISPKDPHDSIVINRTSYYFIDHENHSMKVMDDSIMKFKIVEDKVYFDGGDPAGIPCSIVNDTVYYHEVEKMIYTISDSVLLRKGRKCYAVNFRRGDWWEIMIIQKISDGKIFIFYPIWEDVENVMDELGIEFVSETSNSTRDFCESDTVFLKASLRSKHIHKLILQDSLIYSAYYVLHPDSTFTTIADIK